MNIKDGKKIKNNSNNSNVRIVLRKKSLNNGDLSKYIPKNLFNFQNKTIPGAFLENSNINNLNNVKNSIMPLTISQKKSKQNKEYQNNVKVVKSSQENLNTNLKFASYKAKTEDLNIFNKLPNNIDENEELAKMLLKNPEDMTIEERTYITSLSQEEFIKFIKFLKIKNKELAWRGNDWGSGHYSDLYINIYRATGFTENEKFLSLKNFLKLNHKNWNAGNTRNNINFLNNNINNHKNDVTNNLNNFKLNNFAPDNNANENNFCQSKQKLDTQQEEIKNNTFETQSKNIIKELENLKNILLLHKNEVNYKKIETQNEIIFGDLERKTKIMRDDVYKMKNIKNDKNSNIDNNYFDAEKLFDNFKSKQRNLKEDLINNIEESSTIKKIQMYMGRMKQSAMDLIKKLDIDANINLSVNLKLTEQNLIRLKILGNIEAENFCTTLKLYHGENVKIDYLITILETYVPDDINLIINDEKSENQDEIEINDDDDYDYFNFDQNNHQEDEKRKRLFAIRTIKDFDELIKNKSAVHIQRIFRGHLSRKSFKIYFIYVNLLVKRMTIHMRGYNNKIKKIKNEGAYKITYFIRKFYLDKNMNKNLSRSTEKWLKRSKNLFDLPFSNKNKNRYIRIIQKAWKEYKLRLTVKMNF